MECTSSWAGKKGEKSSQGREGKAEPEARDVVSSTPEGTKKEWLEWKEKSKAGKCILKFRGGESFKLLKKIVFEGKFT